MSSMFHLKAVLERVGLLLFGLVLSLGMAEAGFRLAGIGGPAQLDSTFDRRSYHYLPQVERLNPWARLADGDALRLALIGDSFTAGEASSWDDVYTWRLERLLNLNAGTRPAAVQVFARKGTSTHEQVGFLAQALAWDPDILILGMFLNDAEDPADPRRNEWYERMLPRLPEEEWKRKILRSSYFLGTLYQRLDGLRARDEQLAHMHYIYDAEYSGWKKMMHALGVFREQCELHDIRLLAVVFPTTAGLDGEYLDHFVHRRLHEALEANGIRYFDLLDSFLGKSPLRLAAYPGIDGHPDEIGHRIAAHAIFDHLLEDGWIDESYRPARGFVERTEERWLERTRRIRSVVWQ